MMKNFNILGVHGKIRVLGRRRLGGGGLQKNNILWGIALKGGAWTVFRFKGVLAKRGGSVFVVGKGEGVDTPMHTMEAN